MGKQRNRAQKGDHIFIKFQITNKIIVLTLKFVNYSRQKIMTDQVIVKLWNVLIIFLILGSEKLLTC